MNKVISMFFLIIGLAFFTSCGGKSDDNNNQLNGSDKSISTKGADADGYCTQETISYFNNIKVELDRFISTKDKVYLRSAQMLCIHLKDILSDNTCIAMDIKNRTNEKVGYFRVQNICEKIDNAIKLINAEAEAENSETIAPLKSSDSGATGSLVVPAKNADSNKI